MLLVELNGHAKHSLIGLQAARMIMREAKFSLVSHRVGKNLGNPYYLRKCQFSNKSFLQWRADLNRGA